MCQPISFGHSELMSFTIDSPFEDKTSRDCTSCKDGDQENRTEHLNVLSC
uniref:Uncharacterized protein n=1 Tax=Arion vulgaris TaxID=1028688 RepID=A0A0B7BWD7_9EUPU